MNEKKRQESRWRGAISCVVELYRDHVISAATAREILHGQLASELTIERLEHGWEA